VTAAVTVAVGAGSCAGGWTGVVDADEQGLAAAAGLDHGGGRRRRVAQGGGGRPVAEVAEGLRARLRRWVEACWQGGGATGGQLVGRWRSVIAPAVALGMGVARRLYKIAERERKRERVACGVFIACRTGSVGGVFVL
jgi:hypothetical protein